MTADPITTIQTRVCVAGGGPAGMMLGLLLARAGVACVVLEKHPDFLRDFRGDTVHPSTLQILAEIGLLERFARIPQHRVQELKASVEDDLQPIADFRGLRPFDYLALAPQWDLLNLLADAGRAYPAFDLRMQTDAQDLLLQDGRVIGLRAASTDGALHVHADLVVDCSGRRSALRAAAGWQPVDYGAPMDVLWFRLPRDAADSEDTFGRVAGGHMLVLLNRNDYWQAALVVAKGSAAELQARPIEEFRRRVARVAPFLAERVAQLADWSAVKYLEVEVNRLATWHRPGLLAIGDAAHAMSPVGGVGINLAVQDAVAAANLLIPVLHAGRPVESTVLRAIQRRREWPTRVTQALQLQIQRRVITRVLNAKDRPLRVPALLRWLLQFRRIRNIPARLIGYGVRREHVAWSPQRQL